MVTTTRWLALALALSLASAAAARDASDPIRMAYVEGDLAGYSSIFAKDGSQPIGFVEYVQHRKGDTLEAKRVAWSVGLIRRIPAPKGESRYALEQGDVTALGKLMHEHWLEKKRVSTKISNPKIDEWYECGLQNGALGGKVMGAGGGGLLLFCCEAGRRKELRSALEAKGLQHMDFRFDWDGSRVMVNLS